MLSGWKWERLACWVRTLTLCKTEGLLILNNEGYDNGSNYIYDFITGDVFNEIEFFTASEFYEKYTDICIKTYDDFTHIVDEGRINRDYIIYYKEVLSILKSIPELDIYIQSNKFNIWLQNLKYTKIIK